MDYYQIIDNLLFTGLQAEELEQRLKEFEAAHGKEARTILEDKLEQAAKNVLAYFGYFGE